MSDRDRPLTNNVPIGIVKMQYQLAQLHLLIIDFNYPIRKIHNTETFIPTYYYNKPIIILSFHHEEDKMFTKLN